jgi:hypothetical protein
LLKSIAEGLKKKPAYLLIFSLAALFFVFSVGDAIAAAVQQNTQLWGYAFGGLLVSAIAAVIVILRIEPKQVVQSVPINTQAPSLPKKSGNKTFDDVLSAIHNCVCAALEIDNETFHEAILERCTELQTRASEWASGQLHVRDQYNRLLILFYERAHSSVFSTSIPGYLSAWTSPFGERLREAHAKSHAAVTRIFIFNNRSEITDDAIAIMKEQMDSGIRVRVHFSDEGTTFQLPPDIGNDFTVIDDGEAIGVTLALGADQLAATWYIQDENRKQRFKITCEGLIRDSEDFSKFYAGSKG